MNRVVSAGRWLLSPAGQRWLVAALVGLSVLPFVVLAFYSHPALDDFSDALMRRQLGFWGAQRDLYIGWTGRFATSLLLMETTPLRWAAWPSLYWVVPLAALLALVGSLYVLLAAVAGAAWSGGQRWLAVGAVLALWLAQAPSMAECLYWYNGVAVYTLPNAALLLWLVALARLVRGGRAAARHGAGWVATAGLSVLLIGSNEVVALLVLAAVGGAALWAGWRRNGHAPALLLLLTLLALTAAVAFLAPGNLNRLRVINRVVPLAGAAVGTVGSAGYLVLNWLSEDLLLAATALALPALARLVARPGTLAAWVSRAHPLLLAAGLFGLLVLVGAPSYWATGGMMPLRARTAVYLLFLLGWLALALATLHWSQRRWPRLRLGTVAWPRPVAALLWAWLLVGFATDHNVRVTRSQTGVGSNNVVRAYRDWLSGDAARYDAQQRARYRLLAAAPRRTLRLAPLTVEPPTIIYYDITNDSTYSFNQQYAKFFGQRAVWVGPGGHDPYP